MVFVEVAGEDIHRFIRLQKPRDDVGRVHPVVEYQDAPVCLEGKAAMEKIGQFHKFIA